MWQGADFSFYVGQGRYPVDWPGEWDLRKNEERGVTCKTGTREVEPSLTCKVKYGYGVSGEEDTGQELLQELLTLF